MKEWTDQLGAICAVIEDCKPPDHFAVKLCYKCHKVHFLKHVPGTERRKLNKKSIKTLLQWETMQNEYYSDYESLLKNECQISQ